MTTVTTRTVEYPADGLTMIGHLALSLVSNAGPRSWSGPKCRLNDFQRRRADAVAELGVRGPSRRPAR